MSKTRNIEARLFHRLFNERISQLKKELRKSKTPIITEIKLGEVQQLYNNFYSLKKEKLDE